MSTCTQPFGRCQPLAEQMAITGTIPPGPNPTYDINKPTKLPCGNPVECAVLDKMIARMRAGEWHYVAHADDGTRVRVAGYTREHLWAWLNDQPGSQPPPGAYVPGYIPAPPPTLVPGSINQYPGEEA